MPLAYTSFFGCRTCGNCSLNLSRLGALGAGIGIKGFGDSMSGSETTRPVEEAEG